MKTNKKFMALKELIFKDQVYITEGPIDSLFVDNCLAAAGADLILKNKIKTKKSHIYLITNQETKKL